MKTFSRIGLMIGTALIGALTGCVGYVEQPRPQPVYNPPQPAYIPPPVAYVPPPPPYVPPPVVYVQPPPVYVPPPAVQEEFATARVEVVIRSENDFYEPLNAYGRWEVVGNYGRCWIPARVEADWRPYSNGHWERTEAGWYWASDEPWAWATYHYGRWDVSAQFGWFWVPQTQWAPAWVSWHRGGGYLGWAPLQPVVTVVSTAPVQVNVSLIAPRAFVFVEEKRFLEPVRPSTVVVNNTTIINKTVNITNIKVVNNTVINEGPRTQIIEEVSGRPVQAVPVRELRRKGEAVAVARQRTATPAVQEKVQPPVRREVQPRDRNAQLESENRAKDLELKAQQESLRTAQELTKKGKVASEQQAKESERIAQEFSRKAAQDLAAKAQLESEQRAKESQRISQESSRKAAQDLAKKAQLESEQRAKDSDKKAPESSRKPPQERAKQAEVESQRRGKPGQAVVKRPATTNTVVKGRNQKAQEQDPQVEKPIIAPPPPAP